jgi:hypothetical protein
LTHLRSNKKRFTSLLGSHAKKMKSEITAIYFFLVLEEPKQERKKSGGM